MIALRSGWRRGLILLRQSFSNGPELFSHLLWPLLMVGAAVALRGRDFGAFSLGALAVPSILGMNAAFGMVSLSQQLTADREDGTLLRARATPHGLPAYLIGTLLLVGGGLLADLAVFLVPAALLVPGLVTGGAGTWLTVVGLLALAMVATLPLGVVLGSAFGTARAQSLLTLPILGLVGISGIFYPLAALPGWLQAIGQVFPFYWLGLGMRAALLPDAAVAVELGDSWRHAETVGVLAVWAVAGLLVAPVVLRRMARRESGSLVAARRDRALRRVG
ncbi:ABC-2 type transport system permease protein [Asanoa hainanensis]|uniref:ABC-2 type transport system permease protein n=1 Tax=Asanoa hainanensis TaxID=560556 RepID=A0A239GI93_9ACTN|nr:ABC transporter permease [Asanoa hainanensis]SNS68907.1 ABC-2 type transport system permease protein [Asanoa hainanensis]